MISELLKQMLPEDRESIMDAFNNLYTHIHKLDNGYFLAVHLPDTKDMDIKETNGVWFYGQYTSRPQSIV